MAQEPGMFYKQKPATWRIEGQFHETPPPSSFENMNYRRLKWENQCLLNQLEEMATNHWMWRPYSNVLSSGPEPQPRQSLIAHSKNFHPKAILLPLSRIQKHHSGEVFPAPKETLLQMFAKTFDSSIAEPEWGRMGWHQANEQYVVDQWASSLSFTNYSIFSLILIEGMAAFSSMWWFNCLSGELSARLCICLFLKVG